MTASRLPPFVRAIRKTATFRFLFFDAADWNGVRYTVSDMVWEQLPVQCVFRHPETGECEIDFGLFHHYAAPLDLPADEEWWPLQSHA